jgi:integrase
MYAYPTIGGLPVSGVDKSLVLKVLQAIWREKNETASRLRGRIEAVLDFAKVKGWRDGDNPAAWTGNLVHALPAPASFGEEKHHAALPYGQIPQFMRQVRDCDAFGARALEFLVLTATRTAEVIGAQWSEIQNGVWTIPASRMKAGKEHRVPLSDQAALILKLLPQQGQFVFAAERPDTGISGNALRRVMNKLGYGNTATVHGFRSTFRDWAAERTSYPNHVLEMALAHVIGNKVEAAYRRGDLFEKRRRLMNEWSRYCSSNLVAQEVVSMRSSDRRWASATS